jgi:hypothetical protein
VPLSREPTYEGKSQDVAELAPAATTCRLLPVEDKTKSSTALIAALFRIGVELHGENLPSRAAWRNVRGFAEVFPSRLGKAITASAFSRGFVLATVNFSAIPVD